ncbi:TPA: hypothetical protein DEO28_02420 [Candidatus Dependentiae bacterium]|nr:MAG: hypothetical protein UR14_C0008G0026 [candidate division TM6 bacterium GW2011_GWE2_31_21]KKP53248.1 MAG: hypothetical protein UR43_C0006G0031 [candidate division TM6 bacterium GW2011_GWF2_33_332]HBS48053.1 hypothetical protein [Candidatus Dependentiae bacterium]HBZ73344.1 hypothetical protein [Candidatus Dependentiae bacterium]
MISKLIEKILNFINQLDQENFKKYLIILIGVLLFIIGSALFFIQSKSSSLINQIQAAQRAAINSNKLIIKFQNVENQKSKLQKNLDSLQDFDIKGFFESFTRSNKIKSDGNWTFATISIAGNDLLEETSLQATFKNLTMEKLVSILKELEEKDNIYVKNLKITREENKTLSIDIMIGTLKYKQVDKR